MQYYTIDDLRRSPDQSGRSGWSMERFGTLEEALARYRALPASGARSVGLTDGLHVLELARRAVLFPAESPCEDVPGGQPGGPASVGKPAGGHRCGEGRRLRPASPLPDLRAHGCAGPAPRGKPGGSCGTSTCG